MVFPSFLSAFLGDSLPFLWVFEQVAGFFSGVLGVFVSDDFGIGFEEAFEVFQFVGEEAGAGTGSFEETNISCGEFGFSTVGVHTSVNI